MKKKIMSLLAACSMLPGLFAQNPLWSLPGNVLKYTPQGVIQSPLPTGDYTGAAAQYAHNAMHDAQGNLLFFVADGGYCSVIPLLSMLRCAPV